MAGDADVLVDALPLLRQRRELGAAARRSRRPADRHERRQEQPAGSHRAPLSREARSVARSGRAGGAHKRRGRGCRVIAMPVSSSWSTRANGLTLLRLLAAPALAAAVLRRARAARGRALRAGGRDRPRGRLGRAPLSRGDAARRADRPRRRRALRHRGQRRARASAASCRVLLPVAIAFAFTQYVLDSRPGPGLRGSSLGRWNGIAYFVAVGDPGRARRARPRLAAVALGARLRLAAGRDDPRVRRGPPPSRGSARASAPASSGLEDFRSLKSE